VEKDHAETELWRELALDALEVIHEAPSRMASISSVANDGLGCSSICLTGGQGSDSSWTTARLRLMASRVPTRQQKAMELITAMVLVYETSPINKLGTWAPERTAAMPVEVATSTKVGAQSIQCFSPKDTERPIRT
jgi:hypothetical protein